MRLRERWEDLPIRLRAGLSALFLVLALLLLWWLSGWAWPTRTLAHRALEHLQQSRHMEKWEVYIWLQAKLGLNDQQAHIGMFSDGMCDEVIRLCYKAAAPLGNLHSAA